mmetsp:Transcript_37650/g.82470  ORF Transcript_37650/g.82470 Transcript_37650/m.82470 type:complete len:503 (+) Transcript_37650:446-1954(+)
MMSTGACRPNSPAADLSPPPPPPPSYEEVMNMQGSASLYPTLVSRNSRTVTNSSTGSPESDASPEPSKLGTACRPSRSCTSSSAKASSEAPASLYESSAGRASKSGSGVDSVKAAAAGGGSTSKVLLVGKSGSEIYESSSSASDGSPVLRNEYIGGEMRLAVIRPVKPYVRPPQQPGSSSARTPHTQTQPPSASLEGPSSEDDARRHHIPQQQSERTSSFPAEKIAAQDAPSSSSSQPGSSDAISANSQPAPSLLKVQKSLDASDSSSCGENMFINQVSIEKTDGLNPPSVVPSLRTSLITTSSTGICPNNTRQTLQSARRYASCPALGARRVSFGNIEIKEYPRAIGDNPSVSSGGPPVSLGRKPVSAFTLKVEDYETLRTSHRRSREEMLLPPDIREDWLREAGYGSNEIYQSTKSAARIRRQRQSSNKGRIVVHDIQNRAWKAFSFLKLKPRRRDKKEGKVAATTNHDDVDVERDSLDCSMRAFDARNFHHLTPADAAV